MFGGVALPIDRLLASQLIRHGLTHCVYDRHGALEVQFLARQEPRLLPVLIAGALHVIPWDNRRGDSARLPCTLWTSLATVEAGGWGETRIEEAVIPAALAFDSGIWIAVKTGVRGLVVADEAGVRRVFPILEPASYTYGIMCKSPWMPCLAEQSLQFVAVPL